MVFILLYCRLGSCGGGYGDDGQMLFGSEIGKPYVSILMTGDTIGCCLNIRNDQFCRSQRSNLSITLEILYGCLNEINVENPNMAILQVLDQVINRKLSETRVKTDKVIDAIFDKRFTCHVNTEHVDHKSYRIAISEIFDPHKACNEKGVWTKDQHYEAS
ncbi:7566_t:CDS:2 [Funneliformis geosporum]|uniref:7566_t:CDS:1 n=1 Tax=Funneliformis geosporum TaxID=1117311 RepID=A0A9W4WLS8_9GLOM|nr:7566_t:CDS:2 [Funneliformis geosporum]